MCLAIPGKIEEISGEGLDLRARVRFSGILKEVSLACLPQAKVGDYVMVHVGLAISIVNQEEAKKIFSYLETMGEAEDIINGN